MKTVLLATGENKKLRPLSNRLPTPLAPLANRPVMLYCIDLLARQGCKQMLVSVHNQAGAIESYFESGQRWGVALDYILQREPLGSAGALSRARKELTETFLVFPADILLDLDIAAALAQHQGQGNAATVVTSNSPAAPHRMGKLPFSQEDTNHLFEYSVKEPFSPWQQTGVYIFEPRVLDFIPDRAPFDIHTQLIPALLKAGLQVGLYQAQGYWNPLETLEDYQHAQKVFLGSAWKARHGSFSVMQFLRINNQPVREGIWIGRNSAIHPSARLVPPVFVGDNCRIGRGVELGPDAVLGSNVFADDDATIRNSTILDHTYLGRLVKAEGRIIQQGQVIDIFTGEVADIVDPFLAGSTYKTIDESLLKRAFEVSLALLLLVLSLPLALVIAALVGVAGGRVFKPVTRVHPSMHRAGSGRESEPGNHPVFQLYRFSRGLINGQENRLSRWLERWQVYRLPELWNVVLGDLRLVGVHPASPEEAESAVEPWELNIRACAPGITGLWFTQTGPESTSEEIRLADAYYTATRSWDGDLKILRQTPAAWFRRSREESPSRKLEHQPVS